MSEALNAYYRQLGLTENVYTFCQEIEAGLKERFAEIDKIAEYNQLKVIK